MVDGHDSRIFFIRDGLGPTSADGDRPYEFRKSTAMTNATAKFSQSVPPGLIDRAYT